LCQDGIDAFILGYHLEHAVAIFFQALKPIALGLNPVLQNHAPDAACHQFDQLSIFRREDARRAGEWG